MRRPDGVRQDLDAGGAGAEADVGALERARDARLVPRLLRADVDREASP